MRSRCCSARCGSARVPVPINARFKARRAAYVVGNSGMKLLITDPAFAALLEDAGAAEHRAGSSSARTTPAFAAGARRRRARRRSPPRRPRSRPDDDGAHALHLGHDRESRRAASTATRALMARGRATIAERARADAGRPLLDAAAVLPRRRHRRARGCRSRRRARSSTSAALRARRRARPARAASAARVAFPAFETIWLAVLNHAAASRPPT